MAQPPRRLNRLTVRVTDEEEEQFTREAQRRHMTVSEFARQAMLAAVETGGNGAWWEKPKAS